MRDDSSISVSCKEKKDMDVKANKGEVRCENKPGVRLWEDFRQKLLNTERRVGNMTEHVRHLEQ